MTPPTRSPAPAPTPLRGRQRGLSLIELMVSLVIGLVMSLALFGVLATSEGRRRSGTGLNDLEQAGSIAMYQLDQWMRSAGSDFSAISDHGYGCSLRAKGASGQTLPLTAALPAPFEEVDPDGAGNFALAPVVILPGSTDASADSLASSDRLVVMAGAAGLGGAPNVMTQAPAAGLISVNNTLAFKGGDLLLVADPNGSGGGLSPCMLTQVATGVTSDTATTFSLGGSFYAATIGDRSLTSYSSDAVALPIGRVDTNPPQFLVIGVGDHDTLFTYDLLQTAGADKALEARAVGIRELHALYGVDNDGDGSLDAWRSPAAGAYAAANLQPGASGATELLRRIKAIRVALVLRGPLAEKEKVSGASLTLFSDLAGDDLAITRTLSDDEQHHRYRVVEATLVLRNNLMLE